MQSAHSVQYYSLKSNDTCPCHAAPTQTSPAALFVSKIIENSHALLRYSPISYLVNGRTSNRATANMDTKSQHFSNTGSLQVRWIKARAMV